MERQQKAPIEVWMQTSGAGRQYLTKQGREGRNQMRVKRTSGQREASRTMVVLIASKNADVYVIWSKARSACATENAWMHGKIQGSK